MQTKGTGLSWANAESESATEKYYQRYPGQLKILKYLYGEGATNEDLAIKRQKVWDNTGAKSSCQTLRDRELMRRIGEPRKTRTYRLHLTDAGVEVCERLQRLGMIEKTSQSGGESATNRDRKVSPPAESSPDKFQSPDEAETEECHLEGAKKLVTVNAYERDREAREKCINEFKNRNDGRVLCEICKYDFQAIWGDEFKGYIHVHHRKALSEIGEEYEVNPIKDLIPVCPNCHAVIHHGGVTREVDAVKELWETHLHNPASQR